MATLRKTPAKKGAKCNSKSRIAHLATNLNTTQRVVNGQYTQPLSGNFTVGYQGTSNVGTITNRNADTAEINMWIGSHPGTTITNASNFAPPGSSNNLRVNGANMQDDAMRVAAANAAGLAEAQRLNAQAFSNPVAQPGSRVIAKPYGGSASQTPMLGSSGGAMASYNSIYGNSVVGNQNPSQGSVVLQNTSGNIVTQGADMVGGFVGGVTRAAGSGLNYISGGRWAFRKSPLNVNLRGIKGRRTLKVDLTGIPMGTMSKRKTKR